MSDTKIEWTDTTWNPVRGCTKVSPGCAHCYAETFAERFRGVKGHPYEQGFDLRLVPEKLAEPLSWKKPRRVFVNSMSDLFQDDVPDDFIAKVFAVMELAHWHTFQVLTKRPERMRALLSSDVFRAHWTYEMQLMAAESVMAGTPQLGPWPDSKKGGENIWLGVSVENQHFADERIPLLLETPAAVRFISAEPLLERIDLTSFLWTIPGARLNRLHWVIVGGESGRGARPFHVEWARWLIAQGQSADVPVFVKQLGALPDWSLYGDAHLDIHDPKGGDMSEWPDDLKVREFPDARIGTPVVA